MTIQDRRNHNLLNYLIGETRSIPQCKQQFESLTGMDFSFCLRKFYHEKDNNYFRGQFDSQKISVETGIHNATTSLNCIVG